MFRSTVGMRGPNIQKVVQSVIDRPVRQPEQAAPDAAAPERPARPKTDWSSADAVLQGTSKWYSMMKEDLLLRIEALSRRVNHPYGADPGDEADLKASMKELDDLNSLESQFAVPFSITGDPDDRILFTPLQLQKASRDERFARQLFEASTGITGVPKADVEQFQNRIVFEFQTSKTFPKSSKRLKDINLNRLKLKMKELKESMLRLGANLKINTKIKSMNMKIYIV